MGKTRSSTIAQMEMQRVEGKRHRLKPGLDKKISKTRDKQGQPVPA